MEREREKMREKERERASERAERGYGIVSMEIAIITSCT